MWALFVQYNGQSPKSKFELEHSQTDGRNGQKISGAEETAGIMSLMPGV